MKWMKFPKNLSQIEFWVFRVWWVLSQFKHNSWISSFKQILAQVLLKLNDKTREILCCSNAVCSCRWVCTCVNAQTITFFQNAKRTFTFCFGFSSLESVFVYKTCFLTHLTHSPYNFSHYKFVNLIYFSIKLQQLFVEVQFWQNIFQTRYEKWC